MLSPRYKDLLQSYSYSEGFLELINTDDKMRKMIEGSCFVNVPWDQNVAFRQWERSRSFIARAIKKDGKLLDIGCANGFLLRCLQEWSNHNLIPHGIDQDRKAVEKARKLFPRYRNNFITNKSSGAHFPQDFDHIYWNVWDNYNFEQLDHFDFLNELLSRTPSSGTM
jgi:SAM-dependent methyltransferase